MPHLEADVDAEGAATLARFKLTVASITHGWAHATIAIASTDVPITFSDVPANSLQVLADAAIFAASSCTGAKTIVFSEEPSGLILTTTLREGVVGLDLTRASNALSPTGTRIQVARANMPPGDFALGVWRSLRALQGAVASAHDSGDWRWSFPTNDMNALSEMIQKLKRAP